MYSIVWVAGLKSPNLAFEALAMNTTPMTARWYLQLQSGQNRHIPRLDEIATRYDVLSGLLVMHTINDMSKQRQ
jgi:hypothetical protein